MDCLIEAIKKITATDIKVALQYEKNCYSN